MTFIHMPRAVFRPRGVLGCLLTAALLGTAQALADSAPMYPVRGTPAATDFSLPDVDGNLHRLTDYRGRFVLVNFWAVWCAPCRKEMPSLSQTQRRLGGPNFAVVGVHVGPSRDDVSGYLDKLPVAFLIVVDQDMTLDDWGVRGLPTTVLVDPDGRMAYRAVGEKDWASAEMLQFLSGLIGEYSAARPKIAARGDEIYSR